MNTFQWLLVMVVLDIVGIYYIYFPYLTLTP